MLRGPRARKPWSLRLGRTVQAVEPLRRPAPSAASAGVAEPGVAEPGVAEPGVAEPGFIFAALRQLSFEEFSRLITSAIMADEVRHARGIGGTLLWEEIALLGSQVFSGGHTIRWGGGG